MQIIDDMNKLYGKDQSAQQTAKKPKPVLIVEDDEELIEMYSHKLTLEGFEVLQARNGQEGLSMVISQKPSVVLLDLMMPIMDGKVMLRKIREIPEFKMLPVIVLTNAGDADNIKETQRYDNAVEFIIKSNVGLEEIITKVKSHVW